MKKLQVELEIESKCLNFPDQFSCHYSAFLNLCPLLLSTYCVYLEYQVRVGGMGHLEPLSRESLIPAQRTDTHTHTHTHTYTQRIQNTCSASRLGGLTFTL